MRRVKASEILPESSNPMSRNSLLADQDYFEKTFQLAKKAADQGEVPVGAVVVSSDGKILGKGYNRRESHSSPLAHAEWIAIEMASQKLKSWRLKDCTLYVTLEPCLMCLSICSQARIKKVIYGAQDPKSGALSLGYKIHQDRRLNHRFTVSYVPYEPGAKILKDFFKKLRQSFLSS